MVGEKSGFAFNLLQTLVLHLMFLPQKSTTIVGDMVPMKHFHPFVSS